jgi:hypothetical protein
MFSKLCTGSCVDLLLGRTFKQNRGKFFEEKVAANLTENFYFIASDKRRKGVFVLLY